MTVHAYLTFSGNCREAMVFYQTCLGGKLSFQTIGDSPLSAEMPVRMKNCILHATLCQGSLLLTGSDMVSENGLQKGNTISLTLNCSSEEEIRECYQKLSHDGDPTHPLEETYWGALFGGLTDKYGNNWLLNYKEEAND